jgi:hypothetical protein
VIRKRPKILLGLAMFCLALLISFLLWNQFGSVVEETLPDRYDFGRVHQGATVEFSARFLTSAKKHPVDELFEKIQAQLPEAWRGVVEKVHPKHLRGKAPLKSDVTRIKPKFKLPAFVALENSRGDQRAAWYGGKDFVVANFQLDTSRSGEFSGEIEARWERRKAFLPIKIKIEPASASSKVRRILITETPFDSDSTEAGTNFLATTELLSRLPVQVDLLDKLPQHLTSYETILLAGGTLSRVSPEQIEQLRHFAHGGGRLVLAANAFFGGTVASANTISAGMGLHLQGSDHAGRTTITNIVPDILTRGVTSVPFYRPSLIELQNPSSAKLLVTAGDEGGYLAVSRLSEGGEVILLAQSLWWWWLQQTRGEGDAARLMENILVRENGKQTQ